MASYFYIFDKVHNRECVTRGEGLYDAISAIVGPYKPCPCNGVPLPQEVDSWGELACVGERYNAEDFSVESITEEEFLDF